MIDGFFGKVSGMGPHLVIYIPRGSHKYFRKGDVVLVKVMPGGT